MSDQLQGLKAALVDRYDVREELGAGGMATVYLAAAIRSQQFDRLRSHPRYLEIVRRLGIRP